MITGLPRLMNARSTVRCFLSHRIYSAIFLIAISYPIFFLVYLLARLSESGVKHLEFHLETAVPTNQLKQSFATVKFDLVSTC